MQLGTVLRTESYRCPVRQIPVPAVLADLLRQFLIHKRFDITQPVDYILNLNSGIVLEFLTADITQQLTMALPNPCNLSSQLPVFFFQTLDVIYVALLVTLQYMHCYANCQAESFPFILFHSVQSAQGRTINTSTVSATYFAFSGSCSLQFGDFYLAVLLIPEFA